MMGSHRLPIRAERSVYLLLTQPPRIRDMVLIFGEGTRGFMGTNLW